MFSSETKWLNALLQFLRMNYMCKCIIKQLLNSVFAWYHELSKPRVCVICLSIWLWQITQTSVLIIHDIMLNLIQYCLLYSAWVFCHFLAKFGLATCSFLDTLKSYFVSNGMIGHLVPNFILLKFLLRQRQMEITFQWGAYQDFIVKKYRKYSRWTELIMTTPITSLFVLISILTYAHKVL